MDNKKKLKYTKSLYQIEKMLVDIENGFDKYK